MSNKKSREASESRYISAIKLMNSRKNNEKTRIKKKLKGDDDVNKETTSGSTEHNNELCV